MTEQLAPLGSRTHSLWIIDPTSLPTEPSHHTVILELSILTLCLLREAECMMAQQQADQAVDVLMKYAKGLRKSGKSTTQQKHEVQVCLFTIRVLD